MGGRLCAPGGVRGQIRRSANQHGDAIRARSTMSCVNPRVLVFGRCGAEGRVHAVTLGCKKSSARRASSNQPLRGRHIGPGRRHGAGRPCAGPRDSVSQKYADPAPSTERFADDSLAYDASRRQSSVRMPVGFFKCGIRGTATQRSAIRARAGMRWRCRRMRRDRRWSACEQSSGQRSSCSSEHRAHARRGLGAAGPYPGDDFVLPFGVRAGGCGKARPDDRDLGRHGERCEAAAADRSVDILDLRTLMPWDRTASSSQSSERRRCLVGMRI